MDTQETSTEPRDKYNQHPASTIWPRSFQERDAVWETWTRSKAQELYAQGILIASNKPQCIDPKLLTIQLPTHQRKLESSPPADLSQTATGHEPRPSSSARPFYRSQSPTAPVISAQQPSSVPIPAEIHKAVARIKELPKTGYAGRGLFPSRSALSKDKQFRDDFTRDKGVLRPTCRLREWKGDERLFPQEMWEYLAGENRRAPRKKSLDVLRDTPNRLTAQ